MAVHLAVPARQRMDVPSNHFSMVQEHAAAVADRIHTWTEPGMTNDHRPQPARCSRLQMARGCSTGAFGVNGDPYAMLLRGQDDTPGRWYEQIRAATPGSSTAAPAPWS